MKKINHKIIIPVIIALICALLLLFIGDGKSTTDESKKSSTDNYQFDLEKKLCDLIENVDGVSDVNVMLRLECGVEYVYAVDTTIDAESQISEYHRTGDNESLLIKEIMPVVSGVAVVCNGGDDIGVKNKVIELISNLLDVSSNRIFVGS